MNHGVWVMATVSRAIPTSDSYQPSAAAWRSTSPMSGSLGLPDRMARNRAP